MLSTCGQSSSNISKADSPKRRWGLVEVFTAWHGFKIDLAGKNESDETNFKITERRD